MPSDPILGPGTPRVVCVMVRLVAAADADRRASIESWTPAAEGLHRADGIRRTAVDRANATAMMLRLSGVRGSLLQRGFAFDGGATGGS
ncbi:MAG: hypothetical protein HY060_12565 [Proteobacteria bacterium]|nr:hypothetical protein [Pseudomonadota bacterium]